MNTEEHPFASYIRTIGKGKTGRRSLTQQEAHAAMTMILNDEVESIQLGAFLMVLRVKEESAEEIAGFVTACREFINTSMAAIQHNLAKPSVDLDWSSYAGKKRQPPWFLLAALTLAQSGYKIFMHGASGHTANRLYTEEVLAELNIDIASDWQQCSAQLQANNFSYMPIQHLCPPLHQIIELRPLLGLRSPVHTLARLLNPLAANATLQSVFHPSYIETHHRAAMLLGEKNAAVFKGEGGEVEYRPHADVSIQFIAQQRSESYTLPRTAPPPNDAEVSASALRELWRADNTDLNDSVSNPQKNHAMQAIIGTAAIALKTMGIEQNIDQAKQRALQYWNNRNRDYI